MNKLMVVAIGSAAVAVTSVVVSAATSIRNHFVIRKLEKAIGKVGDMSEEKISDKMINAAVEKAANNKIERFLEDTETEVLREAVKSLNDQAKAAVAKEANAIRDQVSVKITEQVEALDIEALKARVCNKTEERIMKKFDGCLDEATRKFQEKLEDTRRIYDSIGRAVLEKDKKDNDRIRFVFS